VRAGGVGGWGGEAYRRDAHSDAASETRCSCGSSRSVSCAADIDPPGVDTCDTAASERASRHSAWVSAAAPSPYNSSISGLGARPGGGEASASATLAEPRSLPGGSEW
jgi:hypothetical protein